LGDIGVLTAGVEEKINISRPIVPHPGDGKAHTIDIKKRARGEQKVIITQVGIWRERIRR
jgi:hypothetical protein